MKLDKIIQITTLLTTIFIVVYIAYLYHLGEKMGSNAAGDFVGIIVALVILFINKVARFINKK